MEKMLTVDARNKLSTHSWWLESHSNCSSPRRSAWIQSSLAELDEKTKAMLRIIEEDADSFAQRAEMYYKRRPELINMVQDFYKAYRSLAERYEQIKPEPGTRLLTPWASPLSFTKYRTEKLLPSSIDKSYDSYSETCGPEESDDSEVEDPEQEDEGQVYNEMETEEISSCVGNSEVLKLREELARLKEENKIQKEQLAQKDEEKREVIRQLSLAMDLLREENVELRKTAAKEAPKKQGSFEFNKLKDAFLGRLFIGPSLVAL